MEAQGGSGVALPGIHCQLVQEMSPGPLPSRRAPLSGRQSISEWRGACAGLGVIRESFLEALLELNFEKTNRSWQGGEYKGHCM